MVTEGDEEEEENEKWSERQQTEESGCSPV